LQFCKKQVSENRKKEGWTVPCRKERTERERRGARSIGGIGGGGGPKSTISERNICQRGANDLAREKKEVPFLITMLRRKDKGTRTSSKKTYKKG